MAGNGTKAVSGRRPIPEQTRQIVFARSGGYCMEHFRCNKCDCTDSFVEVIQQRHMPGVGMMPTYEISTCAKCRERYIGEDALQAFKRLQAENN